VNDITPLKSTANIGDGTTIYRRLIGASVDTVIFMTVSAAAVAKFTLRCASILT